MLGLWTQEEKEPCPLKPICNNGTLLCEICPVLSSVFYSGKCKKEDMDVINIEKACHVFSPSRKQFHYTICGLCKHFEPDEKKMILTIRMRYGRILRLTFRTLPIFNDAKKLILESVRVGA